MEVTSLREPKMADRVATVLRRMFIRGEITEGTMLPPESELMERFGVSRPTLREAFRVLESESLIQVQRGVRGGARVTRPRRETLARYAGLILEYEGVTLKDVYDARMTLETPMVVQLAKDRNPAVIAELEKIVEREAAAGTGKRGRRPADRLPRRDRAPVGQQDAADRQRHAAPHHREGEPFAAADRGRPRRAGGPPLGQDAPDGAGPDQGRRRREGRRAVEASTCRRPRSSCCRVPNCPRSSTFSNDGGRRASEVLIETPMHVLRRFGIEMLDADVDSRRPPRCRCRWRVCAIRSPISPRWDRWRPRRRRQRLREPLPPPRR